MIKGVSKRKRPLIWRFASVQAAGVRLPTKTSLLEGTMYGEPRNRSIWVLGMTLRVLIDLKELLPISINPARPSTAALS